MSSKQLSICGKGGNLVVCCFYFIFFAAELKVFIFSFCNRSQKLILLAVIVVEMTSSMLGFPISVASRRRPEACSSRDVFSDISQLSGISKGFVRDQK